MSLNPKKFPLEEEALARKAKADAQIEAAKKAVPKEYWGYLQRISHRQFYRVKGVKYGQSCEWNDLGMVMIENVYMRVDGRIAQCRDLHQQTGNRFSVDEPKLVWLPMTEELDKDGKPTRLAPHVVVRVDSDLCGTHYGTARVFFSESGVNQSNPWENGITSALGRALGSMGFGLVESGMASAEEIMAALKAQDAVDEVPEGQDAKEPEKVAPEPAGEAEKTAKPPAKGKKGPRAGKGAAKKAEKKEEPKKEATEATPDEDNPYAVLTAKMAEKGVSVAMLLEWASDEGLLPEGEEASGELTDISINVARKLAEDFKANVLEPMAAYNLIMGLFKDKGLTDEDIAKVKSYVTKQQGEKPWSKLAPPTRDFFLNHWERAWGIIQKG